MLPRTLPACPPLPAHARACECASVRSSFLQDAHRLCLRDNEGSACRVTEVLSTLHFKNMITLVLNVLVYPLEIAVTSLVGKAGLDNDKDISPPTRRQPG